MAITKLPRIIACPEFMFNECMRNSYITYTQELFFVSTFMQNISNSFTPHSLRSVSGDVKDHQKAANLLKAFVLDPALVQIYIEAGITTHIDRAMIVPLQWDIIDLYDKEGFDITVIRPHRTNKWETFNNRMSKFFNYHQNLLESPERIGEIAKFFTNWDKLYEDHDNLIFDYELSLIEFMEGERIENYYNFDTGEMAFHNEPFPEYDFITHKEYFNDTYPNDWTVEKTIEWMNKELQTVPEEYRSSASFDFSAPDMCSLIYQKLKDKEVIQDEIAGIKRINQRKRVQFNQLQELMKQISFD